MVYIPNIPLSFYEGLGIAITLIVIILVITFIAIKIERKWRKKGK